MALRAVSGVTASDSTSRVIPAQVNFLTIYNPKLGDTDETEQDQIVFWVDKDGLNNSRSGRKITKDSDVQTETDRSSSDEQALNNKMRQIGLARGMNDFARNFANDQPLDTIETDRSRIILHELESNWWILASIDLTRLPVAALQAKNSADSSSKDPQSEFEYSAREVSPAVLLRAQLVKAHNLFLMHHAVGLDELLHKLGRPNFCALLNRFWEGYARNWDVLMHGNPAVDVYGDCMKLAGGGELGLGVGEEEWGSGEREVLEGFLERTEGCLDCIVGRYGDAPREKPKRQDIQSKKKHLSVEGKGQTDAEVKEQPWLGCGEDHGPADGVVFSGIGGISRRSLATISQWMEAIFKHGDSAYGVGENPASRPRQRRTRTESKRHGLDTIPKKTKNRKSGGEIQSQVKSPKSKAPDLRRQAMENSATPGIPAPLIGAVEQSLDEAIAKAATRSRSNSRSPKSSPKEEKSEDEAMKTAAETKDDSSVFSMEGVKNILSFGYGSSWTLSPNGFDKKNEDVAKKPSRTPTIAPSKPTRSSKKPEGQPTQRLLPSVVENSKPAEERLQEIDPTPEVSDEDLPFVQRLEQSMGKFIIGLSGDLENAELDDSSDAINFERTSRRSKAQRIFLRTLTVELPNRYYSRPGLSNKDRKFSQASDLSKGSRGSGGSTVANQNIEPKTSAAASVDGANPTSRYGKVQVAVYVHQPFVFVFLFELHTANLTMPAFYRSIHHQLGPLQKPLLQRTNPTRIAERMAAALGEKTSNAASAVQKHVGSSGNAIYDLVHDPVKNTIRTSIPNIPIPTSPDAVVKTSHTVSGSWYTLGIPVGTSGSPSATRQEAVSAKSKVELWSRIEALNVHGQILNTFSATRTRNEVERSVKTARGWWVLWMKVSTVDKDEEEHKEAFLVRKSADYTAARQESGRGSGGGVAGRWLLRDQNREVSSGSNFSGSAGVTTTNAKSVSEGVGIDARKWVDGLLALTQ